MLRQGPQEEVLKISADSHGMHMQLSPPPVLKYNPATILYTDGSKQTVEGADIIGAGVFKASENVRLRITADGKSATNT